MGSRSVKAPKATAATPVAASAKEADTTQSNVNNDQVNRRRGISSMYNRFGAETQGKSKLGV